MERGENPKKSLGETPSLIRETLIREIQEFGRLNCYLHLKEQNQRNGKRLGKVYLK